MWTLKRSKDYDTIKGMNLMLFGAGTGRDWKKDLCWVLQDDKGAEAGFCSLSVLVGQDKGTAFLSRAGVLPHARGRGLQRRMIKVRCRAAKAAGCDLAITYTAPHNIASSNSLIKEGFLLFSPENKWAGRDMLYWKKRL